MKHFLSLVVFTLLILFSPVARATQADETTFSIVGKTAGPTPFISQLNLVASDTSALKSIQFTIVPKTGSVTRPLSATYAKEYLISRGDLQPATNEIFLPVYGLYDGAVNNVTLKYFFLDGSSKEASTTITTGSFADPCGYNNKMVRQARTPDISLSYDFMMVKNSCGTFSPTILDTDGEIRWVGSAGVSDLPSTLFDNAVYQADETLLYRIDLDGTVTLLHDYKDIGANFIHHNIDRGKNGVILEIDTADYTESIDIEVDAAGNLLKTWNLAEIISAAMRAGGDDPSQFVTPAPLDWFHNNGVAYNRADDSILVSSRENFVICLDYETGAIKWILGDQAKKWYQFPSLAKYALILGADTLAPIGQHAPSVTYDQGVMVFDNGLNSFLNLPPGTKRTFASPRKYQIDPENNVATEVWNFEMSPSVDSPICSSVYEDAPLNYLVDYAHVGDLTTEDLFARLLGLNADGEKVFDYQYESAGCFYAFNSVPLHLENTKFPTVGPQALNLSTRGTAATGDNALIGGFIVTGATAKKVALRVLGPSLQNSGIPGFLADPVLTLHDSAGASIAMNDNWQNDPGAEEISAEGLAPGNAAESAVVRTLEPGAYTVVVTGKNGGSGTGLIEIYDLSPEPNGRLANISTRASVGTGDKVLIGGFIVGDVASSTVVIRALGPSLGSTVTAPLGNPTLTIYDRDGVAIGGNDNWQDDAHSDQISANGLAPRNANEAATILNLPAGAYSAVVRGAGNATGVGLVEIYDLDSLSVDAAEP